MTVIRVKIRSLTFDNLTLEQAVDSAMQSIGEQKRCRVVTPNAEMAMQAEKDKNLLDIINRSNLVLPDGIGVIHAAKILKKPLRQRVAGVDFAEALCGRLQNTGKRLFLYGAKPGVAKQAAENLRAKHPGLLICGLCDGYCDQTEALEKIDAASPDALFVCLGSPKQELFMAEHIAERPIWLCAGLGGSMDIFAGTVKRAPKFFQKLGLEWFYRLIREPKRITRMIKLPLYLMGALWHRMKGADKSV